MKRRTFLGGMAGAALAVGATRRVDGAAKYRACVIGDSKQGGYGHSLHLMWGLREDVEVVGLADPVKSGRTKHGAEAGAKRLYADYGEMLEKEKPDLVAVGPRWTIHHKEYLLACAEVGAHGILEKPLATDLAEGDAIIRATDAKRLKWSMAFNFRASPVMAHAKKLIGDEGLIGDVLEVRGRGKEDHRAGGEDLIVLGVHTFDLMRYFFGDPLWCSSRIGVGGREATMSDVREATEPLGPIVGDRVQAVYAFANGMNGYFTSMKNADGNGGRWGMEIYGSKGVVTIRMGAVPELLWLEDAAWAPGMSDAAWKPLPNAPIPKRGSSQVWHYRPIIDDLIASIEEDRRPAVSLHDGLMATEMIQAVWASHVRAGARVAIPMRDRGHPLTN